MDDFQTVTPDSELEVPADETESISEEEESESLSEGIARFLRTCWVKRRTVFGILLAGILLSATYALILPNFYTSTTSLMPPGTASPESGIMSALSSDSAVAAAASDTLGFFDPGKFFIGILESRNVQDGLIARLDLVRYYKSRNLEDARKSLADATKIKEDEDSTIITISVGDKSPVVAANIARGYVQELNRVVTNNTTSAARRERIFLEGRVNATKQQLDESAKELSQFSSKSGAIDVSSQTRSMVDAGLKLQAELIDGRSVLAALRQTYSEDNVRVRAQEANNAELQRQIDKLGGFPQGAGAKGYADNSPYPTAEQLPALGLTYFDLERKLTVQESLWETLTKEYEAAKVEEAAEIPTVQVLDAANVPLRKTSPVRRLIVEIAALISVFVALITVFVSMKWEEMNPEAEPKKLIMEAASGALNPRHRFWRFPGLSWIHKHIGGSA